MADMSKISISSIPADLFMKYFNDTNLKENIDYVREQDKTTGYKITNLEVTIKDNNTYEDESDRIATQDITIINIDKDNDVNENLFGTDKIVLSTNYDNDYDFLMSIGIDTYDANMRGFSITIKNIEFSDKVTTSDSKEYYKLFDDNDVKTFSPFYITIPGVINGNRTNINYHNIDLYYHDENNIEKSKKSIRSLSNLNNIDNNYNIYIDIEPRYVIKIEDKTVSLVSEQVFLDKPDSLTDVNGDTLSSNNFIYSNDNGIVTLSIVKTNLTICSTDDMIAAKKNNVFMSLSEKPFITNIPIENISDNDIDDNKNTINYINRYNVLPFKAVAIYEHSPVMKRKINADGYFTTRDVNGLEIPVTNYSNTLEKFANAVRKGIYALHGDKKPEEKIDPFTIGGLHGEDANKGRIYWYEPSVNTTELSLLGSDSIIYYRDGDKLYSAKDSDVAITPSETGYYKYIDKSDIDYDEYDEVTDELKKAYDKNIKVLHYDDTTGKITDIPLRYEKVSNEIYDTLKKTNKYTDAIKTKTSEPIIHSLNTDYLNDFEEATIYLQNPNILKYEYDDEYDKDNTRTTKLFFLSEPERAKIKNSNKKFIKFNFKKQKIKTIGGYNVEDLDLRLDISRDIIYFDTSNDYKTDIVVDLRSSYDMERFKYDKDGIMKGVRYTDKTHYSNGKKYYTGSYTKPYEYAYLKVLSEKDSNGNNKYYISIPILYHKYDYDNVDNEWHTKGLFSNNKKISVNDKDILVEDAIGGIDKNPIRISLYKIHSKNKSDRSEVHFDIGSNIENGDIKFITGGLPTYTTENDLLLAPSRNKKSNAKESITNVSNYIDNFHTDLLDDVGRMKTQYKMASNNTGLHQIQTISTGYYYNRDSAGNLIDNVTYRNISASFSDLTISAETFDGNVTKGEKNIKSISLYTNYIMKHYESDIKFSEKDASGNVVGCDTAPLSPDMIPGDIPPETNMEATLNYKVGYIKLYLGIEEIDCNIEIKKEKLSEDKKLDVYTSVSNVIVKKNFINSLTSRDIIKSDPIEYNFENIYKLIPHALNSDDRNAGGNMYAYTLEFYKKTPVMLINQNMHNADSPGGIFIKMYDLIYNTLYKNKYSVVDATEDEDGNIKYIVYGGEEYTKQTANDQTKSRTSEPDSATEVTSNINTETIKHNVAIVPSQNENIENPDIIIRKNIITSDVDENKKIISMLDRETTGAYKTDTLPCTFSSPDLESIEEHKSRIIESGLYNVFKFASTTGACVGSSFYNDLKKANMATLTALLNKENTIFNPSVRYTDNTIFEYYSRLNGMNNLLMPITSEKEKQFRSYSSSDSRVILSKEKIDSTDENKNYSDDRSFISASPYSRLLEYEKYPLNIIKNTTMNKLYSIETTVNSTGEKEYISNFFDENVKNDTINYKTRYEKFSNVLADTIANMYRYEHSEDGVSRKQNIYNYYDSHYSGMFKPDNENEYERKEENILNDRIESVSEKMVFNVTDDNKKTICADIISKLGEKYYINDSEYRWVIL